MKYYEQLKTVKSAKLKLHIPDPFEELNNKYKDCQLCTLCSGRDNIVYGKGAFSPLICIIGDSPSKFDSEKGRVFADKTGEKLYGMLEYLNRKVRLTNNVYYTNLTLCPNPENNEEANLACADRLRTEIQIANPEHIIALGHTVANFIMGNKFEIEQLRLKQFAFEFDKYYKGFVTHSLKELMYKNDETKQLVKEELDYIANEIIKGRTPKKGN